MFVDLRSMFQVLVSFSLVLGLGCGAVSVGELTTSEGYAMTQIDPATCEDNLLNDCFWAKIEMALASTNHNNCSSACATTFGPALVKRPSLEFCGKLCLVEFNTDLWEGNEEFNAQTSCADAEKICEPIVTSAETQLASAYAVVDQLSPSQLAAFTTKAFELCANKFDNYEGEADSCELPPVSAACVLAKSSYTLLLDESKLTVENCQHWQGSGEQAVSKRVAYVGAKDSDCTPTDINTVETIVATYFDACDCLSSTMSWFVNAYPSFADKAETVARQICAANYL